MVRPISPETLARVTGDEGMQSALAVRPLSVVLAEFMLAEAELKRLNQRAEGRALSEIEEARWSQLEDTIWLRRDEAKAVIEAATGVSWDNIEAASL